VVAAVTVPASAWVGSGRITGRGDVQRALAAVNAAAQRTAGTAALAQAVRPATDAAPAATQIIGCPPGLAALMPWPGGMLRGATISAVGSASLTMALLAAATADGGFAAVVGMDSFGALAALDDFGIAGQRLALVRDPGPDWPAVVTALLDGVSAVALTMPSGTPERTLRALSARARERRTVLIPTQVWPGGDLVIEKVTQRWTGLGNGRGRLRRCEVDLRSVGRGKAVRPRTATLNWPPGNTEPESADPGPVPPARDAPAHDETSRG